MVAAQASVPHAVYVKLINKGKVLDNDELTLAKCGVRYGAKMSMAMTKEFHEDQPSLVRIISTLMCRRSSCVVPYETTLNLLSTPVVFVHTLPLSNRHDSDSKFQIVTAGFLLHPCPQLFCLASFVAIGGHHHHPCTHFQRLGSGCCRKSWQGSRRRQWALQS